MLFRSSRPSRDRPVPARKSTGLWSWRRGCRDDVNRARVVRAGVSSPRPCGSSARGRPGAGHNQLVAASVRVLGPAPVRSFASVSRTGWGGRDGTGIGTGPAAACAASGSTPGPARTRPAPAPLASPTPGPARASRVMRPRCFQRRIRLQDQHGPAPDHPGLAGIGPGSAGAGLRNASSAQQNPPHLAPCEPSATESACARSARARLAQCDPR